MPTRDRAPRTLLTVPTIPLVDPQSKQAKANAEEKFNHKVLLSYPSSAHT
ncbi:hypothetical protein QUA70_27015 [Microcoleus sp. LAD1_D5]